jgi:hypothetical protein
MAQVAKSRGTHIAELNKEFRKLRFRPSGDVDPLPICSHSMLSDIRNPVRASRPKNIEGAKITDTSNGRVISPTADFQSNPLSAMAIITIGIRSAAAGGLVSVKAETAAGNPHFRTEGDPLTNNAKIAASNIKTRESTRKVQKKL